MDTNELTNQSDVAVLPEPTQRMLPRHSPPKLRQAPNYHVVIWDDNDHSPEYVMEMLIKIFNVSAAAAYDITWRVHHQGKAVACTCHRELAELRREQIASYGPDVMLKGVREVSMRCTLEEAPS